jgi:hypothetical protein
MVYAPYNLTLIDGSGVQPMLQSVNENLMFGWYGALALITIAVIMFMAMVAYSNNIKKSAGLTSIIIATLSVGFRIINLVSDDTVIVCWVIGAVIMMLVILMPD